MNTFREYTFRGDPQALEILLALISNLPFEGFEEFGDSLTGYLPESSSSEEAENRILQACESLNISFTVNQLEDKNWNALWESNFKPVILPGYVMIRAEFHDRPNDDQFQHIITIMPRMAFGTGHHATTRMMLLEMQHLDLAGKSVLDYGCGTGILAIVASQRGAQPVVAIDIDPNCTENTRLNAENNTSNLTVITGDIDRLDPGLTFDVVLANINRNVILEALPALYNLTKAGGQVLLSGFLEEDIPVLRARIDNSVWIEKPLRKEEGWVCMPITKIHS